MGKRSLTLEWIGQGDGQHHRFKITPTTISIDGALIVENDMMAIELYDLIIDYFQRCSDCDSQPSIRRRAIEARVIGAARQLIDCG